MKGYRDFRIILVWVRVQKKIVVGVNRDTNLRFSFSSLCGMILLARFLLAVVFLMIGLDFEYKY